MVLENLNFGVNIATIAGAIGVILFVMAMNTASNKKDKKRQLNIFGLLLVAVFVLPIFMSVPTLTQDLLAGTAGGGIISGAIPTTTLQTACPDTTTVTFSSVDKFSGVATGGTHAYSVNGAPIKTVTDKGTDTLSPKDTIQVLFGNETDGTYFGALETYTIGCTGTQDLTTKRLQNGTIAIEVYNEEGNLIGSNGANGNESVAAGDVVTLEAKLKGTFEKGFPGGVLVVEFNGTGTSQIDDIIVDIAGSQAVSVPSVYAITMGANARTKAYSIPPIESNAILTGKIVIDVDDANAPGTDATALAQLDPRLTLYANDYFINKGVFDGPAITDENDAITFGHTTVNVIALD